MSSLLERMVQRTRAPLSGVEPLLQPRYAPQRAAAQRSSRMDAMESLTAESEFSSAESESITPHWEALPVPQSTNAHAISASEAQRAANRIPQREHLPETQAVLLSAVPHGSAAEVLPETQLHQRPPESHNRTAEPLLGTQLHQAPVFQPAAQPAEHLTVTGESAQRLVSAKLASALENPPTQRAKAEPTVMPPAENKSRSRQQRELISHVVTVPDKTNTDVTISIGHIEIRAVQAAEPTLRPGFRPRVSLDDFLNRRNRERK
jgi:hypothetical protein